jgi:hypothetical protein
MGYGGPKSARRAKFRPTIDQKAINFVINAQRADQHETIIEKSVFSGN